MRSTLFRLGALLASAVVLLAGCGGGGGGSSEAPPPPETTATLSGVAATGAPFADAAISVYDRSGTLVGTTTVATDGSYTLSIPLTAESPLVVEAVREDQTLVSTFAETRSTRLNITPLTHLIAARLSPDGNPLSLRANASVVTALALEQKVAEVVRILKPLLALVGDTVDPLTGTFAANGSGHDKVLDSISVDIRQTGTSSNIEITVRAATAEPVSTSFNSTAATPDPLPENKLTADVLPPDGVATMIASMMQRLTACYALPLSQRVSGATSTSTAVTGNAASVIAPECRTLFLGDDPANFLSNGGRVGRDSSGNGAFNSLFRSNATGVVFDQGQLEFLRSNPEKDVVLSYRATDASGNVSNDTLVTRNVAGTLKLVGNQYIYNARVRAFVQDREFLNQPAADYISTGYNVFITNQVDTGGNPIFERVEVTAPNGAVLVFKPNGGRASLAIMRSDGSLTNTPVIRLAARFKNAGTSGTPGQYETGAHFVSPAYTDEELRLIPEQGVWSLKFFHADTSKAPVVQNYRTISRAPTLAEVTAVPFTQMTSAAKAEIRAESAAQGRITFGAPSASTPNVVDLSTAGDQDFWTVPAGASAPISVSVLGFGPDPDGSGPLARVTFDDGANVASSARKARIFCSTQSNADNHCDTGTGVNQYANGTYVHSIELFSVTPRQVELSKMNPVYYLLPR